MKHLCVLMLFFFVGCAGQMTLEELEDEAILTGDWSNVEEHERLLQVKNKKLVSACPDGLTKQCSEFGFRVRCTCVLPHTLPRISRP